MCFKLRHIYLAIYFQYHVYVSIFIRATQVELGVRIVRIHNILRIDLTGQDLYKIVFTTFN